PDPELERAILFFVFIGLSGLISGLIPLNIIDGLIAGSIYSVLFYITINLIQVFYFIKLGILDVWEPRYLSSSLKYIPISLGCSIVGIGLRFMFNYLFNKLRERKDI
ncbi:unnamed protein product, partial [marine sediment metagenome]